MNSGTRNSTLLKAAKLWRKTSKNGGDYLVGRMGGLKVLVMKNRDLQDENDPSHFLFFAEAPDRAAPAGQTGQRTPGNGPGATARVSVPVTPDAPLPLQGGGGGGANRRPPTRSRRKPEPPGPDGAYPELNDPVPDFT